MAVSVIFSTQKPLTSTSCYYHYYALSIDKKPPESPIFLPFHALNEMYNTLNPVYFRGIILSSYIKNEGGYQ